VALAKEIRRRQIKTKKKKEGRGRGGGGGECEKKRLINWRMIGAMRTRKPRTGA